MLLVGCWSALIVCHVSCEWWGCIFSNDLTVIEMVEKGYAYIEYSTEYCK